MSSPSTNTLGKYQIIREIARSNDIVYEANDPSINRRIALKELAIPPNLQGAQRRERIERFWREGKAAGRLSHPNIVSIFEVGKDGDRHFIAMEYLEGQNLRDVLQAGGPLSMKDVTNYTLQLCSALSYAHRNGVIHRDIKPENVQILPGGYVKLTDFGIARLIGEPSITQNGQVFGTPSYMSPEQVAGKDLDIRSDIFSLGVLIYEMVAGHKPFQGDSVVTITYNIMNMEAQPPPGAPTYLVGIIRKAMAKDPDMRYSTVDELVEDLREEKCSGAFAADPLGGGTGAWPSPFGGTPQAPAPQPQGQMTPYGTPIPSPDPFSSPPATPYGGGSATGTSPDPFSQSTPAPAPMPLPAPPRPIMSSETRSFLGVFLLAIGLAGMLVFAIWAVNLAYNSYVIAQTGEAAMRYYEQGSKLYEKGDRAGAIEQWRRAIRVSPQSRYAAWAREAVYKALVGRANEMFWQHDYASQMETAKELIKMQDTSPEGYYYLALGLEMTGDRGGAVDQYDLAIERGGNDEYAISARSRREAIMGSGSPGMMDLGPPPSSSDGGIPYQGPGQ